MLSQMYRTAVLFLLASAILEYRGASAESPLAAKVKSGGKSGFYGSRYGNYYNARDFVAETTVAPPLRENLRQVPIGVAGPHHQNSDHIKGEHEILNVEQLISTTFATPLVKEEINQAVKGGIKGGVKGGIKGAVKGGTKHIVQTRPLFIGEHFSTVQELVPTTVLPYRENVGVKGLPPRISLYPNSGVNPTTYQPDVIITTFNPTTPSSNLVRGLKGIKKGIKRIKGGRKGYNFGGRRQKELFPGGRLSTEPAVSSTESYAEFTTVESYQPEILNLPTVRGVHEVAITERNFPTTVRESRETTFYAHPTTEQYRQETVLPNFQQTELPIQQTELPIQQTELPIQQTELPIQQTELPIQQTELPIQQTELPIQQTELPIQQTELPIQQTELPIQQTELPIQQTELPIQQTELPIQQTEEPWVQQTEIPAQETVAPEVTTHREIEPTTPRQEATTYEDYSQETQGPYSQIQTTQRPLEDVQVTDQVSYTTQQPIQPTTIESLDIQVTQGYEPPIITTIPPPTPRPIKGVKGIKGRPHIKGIRTSDEFSRYPLGVEGSHHGRGHLGVGKGKGSPKSDPLGKSRQGRVLIGKTEREVSVTFPGGSGLYPRNLDPATPLLPSLLNRA